MSTEVKFNKTLAVKMFFFFTQLIYNLYQRVFILDTAYSGTGSQIYTVQDSRSVSQSVCQLVSQSNGQKDSQSVSPSVRQSVSPSVRQSVSPSVRQSVSPSVRQSVSPSVRQ